MRLMNRKISCRINKDTLVFFLYDCCVHWPVNVALLMMMMMMKSGWRKTQKHNLSQILDLLLVIYYVQFQRLWKWMTVCNVMATPLIIDNDIELSDWPQKVNHKNSHCRGKKWSATRMGLFKGSVIVTSQELNFMANQNHSSLLGLAMID